MSEEPTGRRIAAEVAVYTLLVLVVGGAFVAVRWLRWGDAVFHHAPHEVVSPASSGDALPAFSPHRDRRR